MTQHRKHRGYRTQALVAEYLRERGWPYAESTGASRQGADVTGTPDIAVEVKARANFDPLAYVRQAVRSADGRLPFAVLRCNGQGEASIEDWPALVRFGDLVRVLREAGYGDGEVEVDQHPTQMSTPARLARRYDHRPEARP